MGLHQQRALCSCCSYNSLNITVTHFDSMDFFFYLRPFLSPHNLDSDSLHEIMLDLTRPKSKDRHETVNVFGSSCRVSLLMIQFNHISIPLEVQYQMKSSLQILCWVLNYMNELYFLIILVAFL